MGSLSIDIGLLQEFENNLDPRHPERGKMPARVLGFGEISTVLEIGGMENQACKRMPMFRSEEEADAFKGVYREYVEILRDRIGLRVAPGEIGSVVDEARRRVVVYIVQPELPPHSIGHKAIHQLAPGDAERLVLAVLAETAKVFAFNRQHEGQIEVGFDAQISNWAIEGFDPPGPSL